MRVAVGDPSKFKSLGQASERQQRRHRTCGLRAQTIRWNSPAIRHEERDKSRHPN
jgi:hypothetical protein